MSRHTWPHLLEATNQYLLLYGLPVTSKNSTSYLNLFVRYSSLENLAFWLALRFLNHNSRIRFFQNMLFLKKVKKPIDTFVLEQKKNHICLSGYDFCQYPKNLIFGTFWALLAHPNFYSKTRNHPQKFWYKPPSPSFNIDFLSFRPSRYTRKPSE